MRMSDQMLSSVMVALQKSLMEQSDIVPVLKSFILEDKDGEIFVANPPKQILVKDDE